MASRRHFVEEYDNRSGNARSDSSNQSTMQRQAVPKRSRNSLANDSAYHEALLNRSAKRRRNDFDRYIEIPNDPEIIDSLSWWRENQVNYPNLARMARDTLSVPASGCTVE
jgi:predicted RNA-binding protein with PIN domain